MTNEAAERLRSKMHSDWDGTDWGVEAQRDLREALAAERRATVERIRAMVEAVLDDPRPDSDGDSYIAFLTIDDILDAEAQR